MDIFFYLGKGVGYIILGLFWIWVTFAIICFVWTLIVEVFNADTGIIYPSDDNDECYKCKKDPNHKGPCVTRYTQP